ncbi:uncharacterized protein KIAA0825 homolog [Gastrophryne carolinensis]
MARPAVADDNMGCAGEDQLSFALLDSALDMFPGQLECQQLLADIDEKIKANAQCIEECLERLRFEDNGKSGSEVLQSSMDILQWLNNDPGSCTLAETNHDDVIVFLKAMQQFLKINDGQEDMILQFLVDLSRECGVSFPTTANGSSFQCTSQTSLHAIDDDTSMDLQALWDDVRLHLRRHLVARLQASSNFSNGHKGIQLKAQCLQQLCFLYPAPDVLAKYQNIQHSVVVELLHGYSERNIDHVLKAYQKAIPRLSALIKEDMFALSRVIDSSLIIKFINETFFEAITEEITTFFELLYETNSKEQPIPASRLNKKRHKQRVHALGKWYHFTVTLLRVCINDVLFQGIHVRRKNSHWVPGIFSLRQINDPKYYERLPSNPGLRYKREIDTRIDQALLESAIDKNECAFLKVDNPVTPTFYMLPKVHKDRSRPPGRPIISGIGSLTEHICMWVDGFLQPHVMSLASYLRDSLDLLSKLDQLHLPEHCLLVTCDVEALYSNISHELAMRTVDYFLSMEANTQPRRRQFILDAIYFVLEHNYFVFNKSYYRQRMGVAMGAKCAPSIANLFLGWWEREVVFNDSVNLNQGHIVAWFRFIDDILFLWDGTKTECDEFLSTLNNNDLNITLTSQVSTDSVTFLDLHLTMKTEGVIETTLHRKDTATNSLLHFASAHPDHLKRSIPVGQFLRLKRNCSTNEEFEKQANHLKERFQARGYPKRPVTEAVRRARASNRKDLIQKRERKPSLQQLGIVTKFNNQWGRIRSILAQHWDILKSDRDLKDWIPQRPRMIARRAKNLRDHLCHSHFSLTENTWLSTMGSKGSAPCGKCSICKHMLPTKEVSNPFTGQRFVLRDFINCNSKSVVYAIKCSCIKLYVGETKNTLKNRVQAHLSNIRLASRDFEKAGEEAGPHNVVSPAGHSSLEPPSDSMPDLEVRKDQFGAEQLKDPTLTRAWENVKMIDVINTKDHQKKNMFQLTQLKVLATFIKHFLCFEKEVEKASSEILFFSCDQELRGSIQGIFKTDSSEGRINEGFTLDQNSLGRREMPTLKFGWRKYLKEISQPLVDYFPSAIEEAATNILQRHTDEFLATAGSSISLSNISKSYECYGAIGEEQKPRKITKFCFDILEEFDLLFPLAVACRSDSLQNIRACFTDALSRVVMSILSKLEECSLQVPAKAPVRTALVCLSSAVHVLHHLTWYNELLSKRPMFNAVVQRYQEFISNLQIQVTNYCVNVCATSLLHDAESHHWDDNKAFYEGERCSFSIQMWHYFCRGLRHDLWTVVSPCHAQKIFSAVLEQTLALLTFRYSQARPNYKRAPQIRIDILAILFCVEDLLWSVCKTVQELVKPTENPDNVIFKIHSYCDSLLTVLAISSAPLESLTEAIKNNCAKHNAHPSKPAAEDLLYWLKFIHPELFPSKTPSAGEMAVKGQLTLLLSQPGCNWNLLLETLLHPDCAVARSLLTGSMNATEDMESNNYYEITLMEDNKPEDLNVGQSILFIFTYCNLSPQSFTNLLKQYMDQEQLWDTLCSQTAHSTRSTVLWYLRCVLIKAVKGMIIEMTSRINSIQSTCSFSGSHLLKVPDVLLKALPEKWNFSHLEGKEAKYTTKSVTGHLAEAVSVVISKLPSVVACLPPPIKYFYTFAESKISEQYSAIKSTGLLVWNVAGIICHILKDGNAMEQLTGGTLSRWNHEGLAAVCGCLENIVGFKGSHFKDESRKILEDIEKRRPKWVENQLLKTRTVSCIGDFAMQEDSSTVKVQGSSFDLTEQKINMMVLDICHKPSGREYLRQIHHIIQLNEVYLNQKLFSQTSEQMDTLSSTLKFSLTSEEEKLSSFNPLNTFAMPSLSLLSEDFEKQLLDVTAYCHIALCAKILIYSGTESLVNVEEIMNSSKYQSILAQSYLPDLKTIQFDHSTTTEEHWDWSSLLPHCLQVNAVTLEELLQHRYSAMP